MKSSQLQGGGRRLTQAGSSVQLPASLPPPPAPLLADICALRGTKTSISRPPGTGSIASPTNQGSGRCCQVLGLGSWGPCARAPRNSWASCPRGGREGHGADLGALSCGRRGVTLPGENRAFRKTALGFRDFKGMGWGRLLFHPSFPSFHFFIFLISSLRCYMSVLIPL